MIVSNLKIGNRPYVVISKRDYAKTQQELAEYRRLIAEDRELGRLAEQELRSYRKTGKGTPWPKVKQELGL